MQYLGLEKAEKAALLTSLEEMPAFLEATLGGLSASEAVVPGPNDSFAPVEHCWHLADLERQGYAVRIHRLLTEENPLLPDFDGARIAEERQYRSLSLALGLQAFREARTANLHALRSVPESDWERPGRQDGVGAMALCDVPAMMAEHDAGHRAEIQAFMRQHGAEKART
jgi:hypothetical protein